MFYYFLIPSLFHRDKINMMNVVATDEFVSCIIISEEGFDQLMGKSGEFRQRFSEKVPRRLM